jgi:hypothetical protein
MNLGMSTVDTRSPEVCPSCNSTLAYPIDWQQLAESLWLTWLRCPDCESIIARVLDDDAVYALDLALDRGTHALMRQLETIALTCSTDRPAPRPTATEVARRIARRLSGLVRDATARAWRLAITVSHARAWSSGGARRSLAGLGR